MNLPGFTAEASVENVSQIRFATSFGHALDVGRAVTPAALIRRGTSYGPRQIYCAAVCAACGNRDAGEWCWRCSRCQMTGDA